MMTARMAVAIALSAMSFVAFGAGDKADKSSADKSGKSTFQSADADGNGAISMEEARSVPGLADKFAQADKNGDGQLSKSEYESAVKGAKAKSSEKSGQY